MNNTLLNMQIGAQRRVLGWLPEIAARRDARLIVGMGLAGSALVSPTTASARVGGGGGSTGSAGDNANACNSKPIQNIVGFIDYATKALIAVIGAVVLFRFAMAAWTMVASNKANRGKKALNDMMWVGAGLIVVILIFPLRYGIVLVVEALFDPSTGAGDPAAGELQADCAQEATTGSAS